ncbi:hypothetical protein PHMEG_00028997, partial [Phytophthora megakarya]
MGKRLRQVATIIDRNKHKGTIFTIPNDILRFPEFNRDEITEQDVWKQLKTCADNSIWEHERLFFFAVMSYNLDHWCAVAVNFTKNEVVIYDPQQTQDRYDALKGYLKEELIPLLPAGNPDKRRKFKRVEWLSQLDNYNCGI